MVPLKIHLNCFKRAGYVTIQWVFTRFEGLTTMLLTIQVLLDIILGRLVNNYWSFDDTETRWNVSNYLPVDTVQYPKRTEF